jgi:hypothetical protein
MEIDSYGRIYGVSDDAYNGLLEELLNFGCKVINMIC